MNKIEPASKYGSLSKDQLVQILEKRDRSKKLGLIWERDEIEADKAFDENFVACCIEENLCEKPSPWRNLVIEGDNFDALRWLRIGFSGRIKCIYIDPPYNTGNKDWVYNDRYFDASDRYRHSTWLEFLYRRLLLARDLLTEDGVIFVSINDENRSRLELLMDEVFPGMRVGSFVWRTKDTANDAEHNFSSIHEHILIYGNTKFSFLGAALEDGKYKNPDGDHRGNYSADPITKAHTYKDRPNTYYPIQDPKTGWWYPCSPDRVWAYASESKIKPGQRLRTQTIEELIRDNRITFSAKEAVTYDTREELLDAINAHTVPVDGNGRALLRADLPDLEFWIGKPIARGRPSKKSFWDEKTEKVKPVSSYILGSREKGDADYFNLTTDKQGKATGEIKRIFGYKAFDFPKPVKLIKSLLESVLNPGDIVLDFFAGSGTTAQATMELSSATGHEYRFILVSSTEATEESPNQNLCRDVCAKRIRLLNGADDPNSDEVNAEFAYMALRKLNFEDLDYDINPAEVWAILESVHKLPLTIYDASRAWNEHEADLVTLIYADKVTDELILRLHQLADRNPGIFVYAWAPGQVTAKLEGQDIEVRSVHDTLIQRFQQ